MSHPGYGAIFKHNQNCHKAVQTLAVDMKIVVFRVFP